MDKFPFDEDWYLSQNPDVREAVRINKVSSGREHFMFHGIGEGRKPIYFDEEWYLKTNPDIAGALLRGEITTAYEHYINHGFREGRAAAPPKLMEGLRTFAYGAYGTNNVGDEAIFQGLKLEIPELIQIFHQKDETKMGVQLIRILQYEKFFRAPSRLIIGGGGLFYSREAITTMIEITEIARSIGCPMEIQGVGFEAAQDEWIPELRALTKMAERITVRSSASKEYLRTKLKIQSEERHDFAFNLKHAFNPVKKEKSKSPVIGLITGGNDNTDYASLTSLISKCINKLPGPSAKFIHIPQSKSLSDSKNNDVIVGNMIWSNSRIESPLAEEAFQLMEFTSNPFEVAKTYQKLDAVITARFHGIVFARMIGLPTLVLSFDTEISQANKIKSIIDKYQNGKILSADSKSDLTKYVARLIALI